MVKNTPAHTGDPGVIPGLGRSPRVGNGKPLQYSCLENSMDRGAWQGTVHGVEKSQTRLSDFTFTFTFKPHIRANPLEKTGMLGKIESKRRGRRQRMRWLDSVIGSMDMNLNKLKRDGEGQGSLVCCSPWGCKESDTT